MDERRIKEAENNIRSYLSEGLIKKAEFREEIFDTFVRNHKESLGLAKKTFESKDSDLWTIVISYYSMFYIANAVLYRLGYKVGDKILHKVTADALIVFVRNKLRASILEDFENAKDEALEIASIKSSAVVEEFDMERKKRSKFQYDMTKEIKRAYANTSLERAKRFVFELDKLLLSI